tara:strand:+ start:9141 stop:9410 length:270 start_codon:yes stop_codon:yes gene_type:complete
MELNKESYLKIRNNNSIPSHVLYETLQLNPTFKVKNLNEFNNYLELIMNNPFLLNQVSNILLEEFKRLNDIRFNVITIYDNSNNEIKYY